MSIGLSAQVLVPSAATAFEPQHSFNPEFIRSRGIKRIVYDIIDKRDFEVAVDKGLTETYEFDAEGRMTRHYYTEVAKTLEKQVTTVNRKGRNVVHSRSEFLYDTVSTAYFYKGDQVILKRYHDGRRYYESRYYRYDSLGSLTKELRFRETNNATGGGLFILGSQHLMSEDSFRYVRYSSGQVKTLFLNNEHRPYKEKITNYDSSGRVRNIYETYTAASWMTQQYRFTYEKGKLKSAAFEGNTGNPVKLSIVYEYDDQNELYGEKHFRHEALVKEVSYVSDRANGLLNSFVIRDPVNRTMRIVKLRYDLGMLGRAGG